jgi:hypothetical protein
LAARGVQDDFFFTLRANVERDIMSGVAPLGAVAARAREVAGSPRGVQPPLPRQPPDQ